MRYIGSKARVAASILNLIGPPSSTDGVFVDALCGTGAVAEEAARRGWHIRLNDHLLAAVVMARARLTSPDTATFTSLGGYKAAVARLAQARPHQGFIWRHYSPASGKTVGQERRYFTEDNAGRIDGIRQLIRDWREAGLLSQEEQGLLVADLLEAASRVANTAGTYGCFLREWSPSATRPLQLTPRLLREKNTKVEALNADVRDVPFGPDDVAYLDPPYTKRQYAAYYHILETIAQGDEPIVDGITGLRPWQERASSFCYKSRALHAIVSLVSSAPARRIWLSYSSQGHVNLGELWRAILVHGDVQMHPLGTIGRYRPNWQARLNGDGVQEYLLEITKPRANTGAVAASERVRAA